MEKSFCPCRKLNPYIQLRQSFIWRYRERNGSEQSCYVPDIWIWRLLYRVLILEIPEERVLRSFYAFVCAWQHVRRWTVFQRSFDIGEFLWILLKMTENVTRRRICLSAGVAVATRRTCILLCIEAKIVANQRCIVEWHTRFCQVHFTISFTGFDIKTRNGMCTFLSVYTLNNSRRFRT